ncbi:MAG TPA: ABC transporter substrate-binding protein, partial [Candidatus Sulfotelmatobacter sp.]|nr:ABC transporter substrate-binding protein [Candidatus Sulfotelmatobacter sp.]
PVSAAAGPAGKGAESASAYFVGTDLPANNTFVQRYQSKYGQKPDQIAAQAYAGVLIFAEAAKAANLGFSDLGADRDKLRDALEHVSLDTPLGKFSFTRQHDVSQPIYIVAMDGAGGFTLVTTVNPTT